MAEQEELMVRTAMAPLDQMEIPTPLEESIRQHQQNLKRLAASLLASGHGEAMVRRSVETVFNSYRDELVRSIVEFQEDRDHG